MLDASFKNDLALKASFKASSSRGRNFGVEAMQGDDSLYWATKDGVTSGDVCLEWDVPITAKYIVIEEHIALGQRVREFVIDVKQDNKWHQVSAGTTIGHKRIIPLEEEIITNEIRIRFIDARGPLTIARIAVY